MTYTRIRIAYLLIMVLNLIHPAIHSTFLDHGALDAWLESADVWAASMWPILQQER